MVPTVRVDTQQRCAAMVFFDNRLAVIPFRLTSLIDEEEAVMDLEKFTVKSFILNLNQLGVKNVKDYVFLHGYLEPTLLILYEPHKTTTGYVFGNLILLMLLNFLLLFSKKLFLSLAVIPKRKIHVVYWLFQSTWFNNYILWFGLSINYHTIAELF